MLTLRIKIFLTRTELFFLDSVTVLPSDIKKKLAKKICNNIININKEIKEKNVLSKNEQ
ncbi:hypothetical protein CNEO3_1760001 [Clostridium neonatale]|uniref:hypothetical protein n=1 Tax=Clostridium neonatale TaxID=137838 RepID=UPI00291B6E1F|nr:hypothetical protein [Clostridium neonatale]CAI3545392.1 hypothetical protein CNEO3_1950001 [Clostridium neonatale]CAI3567860.1 hypothetical protein CNEO4_1860004 [Clostridium neonatale]CAI3582273.1 hypothetical protein CNEO3_1470003 [Clostridium neonatale]CAI3600847.1 hypothetical protein CNEO3_1760001 [Clostridium neonatale]CAI3665846.1 hypothetical protein CNEO3_1820003 [Clostridium neonatale]